MTEGAKRVAKAMVPMVSATRANKVSGVQPVLLTAHKIVWNVVSLPVHAPFVKVVSMDRNVKVSVTYHTADNATAVVVMYVTVVTGV